MAEEVAYLRDNRYCSVHGIDLLSPDRTLRTRRYCNRCPPGSALGFPAYCERCDEMIVCVDGNWIHKGRSESPCPRACPPSGGES